MEKLFFFLLDDVLFTLIDYGHYIMPLVFIALTVMYFVLYKKNKLSKAPLIKAIILCVITLYYLATSILIIYSKTYMGLVRKVHITFNTEMIMYNNTIIFILFLWVILLVETITRIIKHIKIPKGDKRKKKSLIFTIILTLLSILYSIIVLFYMYILLIAFYC